MRSVVHAMAVSLSCTGLLLATMLGPEQAFAEPTPSPDPTQRDISQSSTTIASLEAELSSLRSAVSEAEIRVQVAAEQSAQAQTRVEQAAAELSAAQADAYAAEQTAQQATGQISALYRAQTQQVGHGDALHALTKSRDVQDLVSWDAVQRAAARESGSTLSDVDNARAQARATAAKADAASALYQQRHSEANQVLADAQAAVASLQATEQATSSQREAMLIELAAARRSTVASERTREQERVAQTTRDQESQARANINPANTVTTASPSRPVDPPATPPSSTSTPGGSGSSGTTPTPTPAPQPSPTPAPPPPTDGSGAQKGRGAVEWAKTVLGAPYELGASGPNYDCSGLTMRAWESVGVSITRTSRSQYQRVAKISYDDLRAGDLIFYATNSADPGSIYHVAMYVGSGQMIEAPAPGKVVRITAVRYVNAMPYAGRP